MKRLSNHQLLMAYKKAIQLNLDDKFLELLEIEIQSRQINKKCV